MIRNFKDQNQKSYSTAGDGVGWQESPSRMVALLFENLPQIISLFKEGPSGWTAAGEANRWLQSCRKNKTCLQVHLPDSAMSLSFFGEDAQLKSSKNNCRVGNIKSNPIGIKQ